MAELEGSECEIGVATMRLAQQKYSSHPLTRILSMSRTPEMLSDLMELARGRKIRSLQTADLYQAVTRKMELVS